MPLFYNEEKKSMKVLFIGDIYGKQGIKTLEQLLPEIKSLHKPNIIIANAENVANGRGITKKMYKQLMQLGIQALTMGNWVWGNKELFEFIAESNIVRPLNFSEAPGQGYMKIKYNEQTVLLINVLGRTFMNPNLDCPFKRVDEILKHEVADKVIIDMHAEATSEKVAFAHYFDGRVDLVVGTHTHVQTNDNRRLPNGTLYITDIGMVGPLNGVIGVKKEIVIDRFLKGFSIPNEVSEGVMQLNAVIVDFNKITIEKIHMECEIVL
jgi:2',3'-cyclic-nucleotide 2'-phosphodiesterase